MYKRGVSSLEEDLREFTSSQKMNRSVCVWANPMHWKTERLHIVSRLTAAIKVSGVDDMHF